MFEKQIAIIKKAAQDAGHIPGVYQMLSKDNVILYVGKARDLQKRLTSYTRTKNMQARQRIMILRIDHIEFTETRTAIEALILENNLIKKTKPFFNVSLKDDTSYPYIVIDETHTFPRIFKYRTNVVNQTQNKCFYGPYPLVKAIDDSLKVIQKVFMLRSCTDNYFNKRTRPCLQYFIKRCSAPCMQKVSAEEYKEHVQLTKNLLDGNDEIARNLLLAEMKQSVQKLDFERAASIRDKITSISTIQSKQYAHIDDNTSTDIIVIVCRGGITAFGVTFFRCGKNVGSDFVFQQNISDIEQFIFQFYQKVVAPKIVVVNKKLENATELSEFFQIKVVEMPNKKYERITEDAINNVLLKLDRKIAKEYEGSLLELASILGLNKVDRIETYDNSHIMGSNACGVMVVFEDGKLHPELYRKFSISEKVAKGGDDISMMKFVLTKRFESKHIWAKPDVVVIDGGINQLNAAIEIVDAAKVISVVKQNDRKMGDEKVLGPDGTELSIDRNSDLFNFLLLLRNEAHKTAITFHRKKQRQSMQKSKLDLIPTIGPKRKQRLLEHFGSVEALKNASLQDILAVNGMNQTTAQIVFSFFRR
jgi:excinuclease ABC subunit C